MEILRRLKSLIPIIIGFIIWLLTIANWMPYSVFELTHVQALLIAAPLWLIPLALHIRKQKKWIIWLAVCCGIFFTLAYQLSQGINAALFVVPWLVFSIYQIFGKVESLLERAAHLYLPIGIFWAIIDRMGITIMGYDPTIVLLTAVHFHYAGFILPQVTSWLLQRFTFRYSKLIALGIIAGIPLVAIGISTSHYDWPGWIEVICVSIMTAAGTLVGLLHIAYGLKAKRVLAKACFILGGLALVVGMALAFCYGWRHVFVIKTLTIPWMYAVHGTCNAVGFAAPVLLGYWLDSD